MKNNEKEMGLERLNGELLLVKHRYEFIRDLNFTPIDEHPPIGERFAHNIFFVLGIVYVGGIGIILGSNLSPLYQGLYIFGGMLLFIILDNIYPLTRRKFYLSNFSTKDLTAIKSDQFLCTEFKKHLVDNGTAVSAEFSKIAENYRGELKNKIDRLSNLKENLERDILVKSM